MKAYHNDPAIKAKYLARVIAHRRADEVVKGKYWENGKGCAVGCTIHGSDHSSYETELGIPEILARLEDNIFENLPKAPANLWPERFLSTIPVGADLSDVWPKFAIWLLTDKEYGMINFLKDKTIIKQIADYYMDYKNITLQQWKNVANAANDAYESSCYGAYGAYAASVAYASVASVSACAAANAAVAYYVGTYFGFSANSAFSEPLKEKVRLAQANKLLELLAECK